jgi:hypothetical protein
VILLPPYPAAGRPAVRLLVLLIGVHSCVLGFAMMFAPRAMGGLLGLEVGPSIFFASQAGIFLLALGACYLLALRHCSLISVILISKTLAVVFLVVHAGLLDAPPIIWAAAAGDGAMLAALLGLLQAGVDGGSTP